MSRLRPFVLLLAVALTACHEEGLPFPDVPNLPTAYNVDDTTEVDTTVGMPALITFQAYDDRAEGLVWQTVAHYDPQGRCQSYYWRDRHECRKLLFEYDSLGRRIAEQYWKDTANTPFDSLHPQQSTVYLYSAKGRRVRVRITGPDGHRHTFRLRYDRQGRLQRFEYPDGSLFSYDYDANGRLLRRVWPDASEERFEYDSTGVLTTRTDRDGTVVWMQPPRRHVQHDSLGRIVEEHLLEEGGVPVITSYAYDDHGNWIRRTSACPTRPTRLDVRTILYYSKEEQ